MGQDSNIEWTDHTFNPWIGCAKVSPGCAHCYAETLDDKRFSKTLGGATKDAPISHWGKEAPRLHKTKTAGVCGAMTGSAYGRLHHVWFTNYHRFKNDRYVKEAAAAEAAESQKPQPVAGPLAPAQP